MNTKRFLAIALAGAISVPLLLTGCSNGGDKPGTDTPDNKEPAANVIRIGGIGPLTGDSAIYGMATKQGAEIAIQEINAKGGLQLEMKFQDDEADPEKAVNAYKSLKDYDMQLLYGCTTTGSSVTVAGESMADRYFQLTPSASSTDVTAGRDIRQIKKYEQE